VILRLRIALWYGSVLFVAVMVVGWWAYNEIQERVEAGPVIAAEEASEGPIDEALEMLLFGALPALALGLLGGTLITRRALQPLSHLTESLEHTHVGNLSQAIARSGNGDEIDRLAMVFNSLKLRLAASFEHAREFTLHASHELKTPVTILHSTLESMLRPETTLAVMRDRCGTLIEEVQRLSGIVTQLAFLAQADSGQQALQVTSVPLHNLVTEAAEDAVLLATAAGVVVHIEALEDYTLAADRMRLRQLLLIVLDNAVKHNKPGGEVRIALRLGSAGAELAVVNTGSTLSAEERSRVFERFFRGTHARDAGLEGSGLGLSIAEHIVRAHGGSICFESTPGGLHSLRIALPFAASRQ
jgi:signal transduction histidine kinase